MYPFLKKNISNGTQNQKFISTCLLMGTPAHYSQIAVGSKRDLILVNLVTGFSMSLPTLNQRRNIVKLSSRLDDASSDKQGSATLLTSYNLWKSRTRPVDAYT